jgi:DNA-binding NarL/FixJ family response regulator
VVHGQLKAIRTKLGVETIEEAWELAKERILESLPALPLDCPGHGRKRSKPGPPALTKAQADLLTLARRGMTVRAAAGELGIAESTA